MEMTYNGSLLYGTAELARLYAIVGTRNLSDVLHDSITSGLERAVVYDALSAGYHGWHVGKIPTGAYRVAFRNGVRWLEEKAGVVHDRTNANQRVFDTAVRGVLRQGRQAVSYGEGRCVFLADNGARCAIGHLLTESECRTLAPLDIPTGLLCGRFGGPVSEVLLRDLQHAHDLMAPAHSFPRVVPARFADVAHRFGLSAVECINKPSKRG